jgi:hypothetical protein
MPKRSRADDDVFVFEKAVKPRKRTEDLTQNKQEGRQIHRKWEELGEATRIQLSLATGCDLTRIDQQIDWALKKGYGKRKRLK